MDARNGGSGRSDVADAASWSAGQGRRRRGRCGDGEGAGAHHGDAASHSVGADREAGADGESVVAVFHVGSFLRGGRGPSSSVRSADDYERGRAASVAGVVFHRGLADRHAACGGGDRVVVVVFGDVVDVGDDRAHSGGRGDHGGDRAGDGEHDRDGSVVLASADVVLLFECELFAAEDRDDSAGGAHVGRARR